jgi:hypothetical protein
MKFKYLFAIFSLALFLSPSISQAEVFKGEVSFLNCNQSCYSSGERDIKFHSKVDFTLKMLIDEDSYFPSLKVVNTTQENVNWSFHIVFFDKDSNIIAAYALSDEAKNTNKYGKNTNGARINLPSKDKNKITNYKIVVYTY